MPKTPVRLAALTAAVALVAPLGAGPVAAAPTTPTTTTSPAAVSALAVTAAGGADAAERAATPADRARLTRTRFAFRANGYGTSASGGMVPVGSDRTALSSMACTSDAGKTNRNFVEETEVPGLGTVRGVFSQVSSSQRRGVTTAASTHKVAEIILADTPLGSLSIDGVESVTRAFHDDENGFQAEATTTIAGISFTPPGGGEPQTFPIPSPGQPLEIPGLAVITLGRTIEKETRENSRAYAVGLVVKVIPTDTVVKVARSAAKLEEGFKSGIFKGSGIPAKANVLGELVQVGRVIRQVMPCTGTEGELDESDAADVDLAEQVVVEGASARQKGRQSFKKATGMEFSRVAEVNLGGQLVLTAIESKVKVTRWRSGKITRGGSASFGAITLAGEPQSLDQLGEIEIPGVAKIETGLRKKIRDGLRIIGVRVTLLDGTGAVIDLATSKLQIRRS